MNVIAVRDDGALLVSDAGDAAAIIVDGSVWFTTRDSALARGDWSDPTGEIVPNEIADHVRAGLIQLNTELASAVPITTEM